jgi:hypothetical protein
MKLARSLGSFFILAFLTALATAQRPVSATSPPAPPPAPPMQPQSSASQGLVPLHPAPSAPQPGPPASAPSAPQPLQDNGMGGRRAAPATNSGGSGCAPDKPDCESGGEIPHHYDDHNEECKDARDTDSFSAHPCADSQQTSSAPIEPTASGSRAIPGNPRPTQTQSTPDDTGMSTFGYAGIVIAIFLGLLLIGSRRKA